MAKTALVVDDSRTALAGLSRLLKERGLLVDTAESGQEAIDYLKHNPPPSAIFLDHMMPGMDGFETLRALKSTPATSAIPVVMYTSKDGEAYMHEAQAHGAFGVLLKPPHPLALQKILSALPETRRKPERMPTDNLTATIPASTVPEGETAVVSATPLSDAEMFPEPRRTGGRVWPVLMALLLAGIGGWAFVQYRTLEQRSERLAVENAGLKREQSRLLTENARLEKEHASAQGAATQSRQFSEQQRVLLDAIGWALSGQAGYDYGEIPFSDARLNLLRGLLTRLTEANFRGVVRLDSHLGEFCLVRDNQGRLRLPPPGTPLSACERVTYPPGEAARLARRQSDAFARYVADIFAARGPIDVAIQSHGASRPLQRYPENASTAAEWNAVARRNQRVDITLIPAAQ